MNEIHVTVTHPADATITIEPAGEPATVEVYSDGTWLVNGEATE